MRTKLITPPAAEPLTVAEARMHLRNPEITSNDAEITRFIKAGREMVEHKTGRALLTQTWEVTLDDFYDGYCGTYQEEFNGIELPYPPLQSVTSISYVDSSGVTQVLAAPGYVVDTAGLLGRVSLAYGASWPGIRSQANAVIIRFVAGYMDAASVPDLLKHYIALYVEWADKNRGIVHEQQPFMSPFAEGLLDRYRIPGV